MRTALALLFALALSALPPAVSAELKLFSKGSLQRIVGARSGEPFLLVLWSVDCPPCMKEMGHLKSLRDRFDKRGLVLVSTDGLANREAVKERLAHFGLDNFDNWVFADDFPERLRYQIDPNWFGELPRSYFYDAEHQRVGSSGALTPEALRKWLHDTAATTAR